MDCDKLISGRVYGIYILIYIINKLVNIHITYILIIIILHTEIGQFNTKRLIWLNYKIYNNTEN